MSHQQPRTRYNARGYPIQSNWSVTTVEGRLYRYGNPACKREFSA